MPLIFLVWVVLGWLQIVAAHTGGGEGFFNGLLSTEWCLNDRISNAKRVYFVVYKTCVSMIRLRNAGFAVPAKRTQPNKPDSSLLFEERAERLF